MSDVQEDDAEHGTDQENHVEPAVIEVELQVSQNFRDYHPMESREDI